MSPAIGRSWCTAGRLQPCRVWIDNGSYRKSTLNASRCGLRAHFSTSNTRRRVQQRDVDLPFLDAKWQEKWESWKEEGIDRNFKNAEGEKKYILPMFPYPSGDLHLGHLRVYTIADVLARYNAMQGYRVMHPIGWDAFGLPAENAAIERGIDPAVWTKQNIAKMRIQLKSMNGDWDWDREFATCDPSYYKHTQRIFLLLHERGLAYQAESLVNYDPVDKTVLANEQVDDNGCSWRSGAKVEQRLLKQWFLKISQFRQPLLDDLKQLKKSWPERVLTMQKHWLGRSMGTKIKFTVSAPAMQGHEDIEVFTTRPNTLFGVQYIALAASHPIVVELAKTDTELQNFLDAMPTLPLDSKAGYLLPDLYALNPLADEPSTPEATKAPLPIYVAPYVLGDYGDGAVMGVPGHDLRDYAFWKQNRGEEPIRSVIRPPQNKFRRMVKGGPYILNVGELTSECGPFAGLTAGIGNLQIIEKLQSKGLGHTVEKWRLRDWLISRQRYWGAPIPIIHCDTCGPVRVPVEDLPVELPNVDSHWLKGKAGNPLEDADDWINTPCPKCGSAAKRDTDTMDTFVDSSWYFTRFPDPHNASSPVSPDAANWALPVDLYVGGVEHAILHLLYARFISKFLATTSLWPDGSSPIVNGEPFKQLLTQGMVHGKTYSDPGNGRFLKPHEVDLEDPSRPVVIATGEIANVSYEKMSKSKYNGVDPTETMAKYGADATRAHILFQAPVTEVLDWDEEKISGVTRWLRRLMTYIIDKEATRLDHAAISSASKCSFDSIAHFSPSTSPEDPASPKESESSETRLEAERILWRLVQQTIISVTDSYSNTHSLNTVVSDLMTLTNAIINPSSPVTINQDLQLAALTTLIKMMAPITPAFAEECWLHLNPQLQSSSGERLSIFQERFPIPDDTLKFLGPKTQKCAVQVNGKLSIVVEIPIPPSTMDPEAMGRWITSKILATEEGWEKLGGATKGRFDIRNAKKAFVIKEGRTVNYIL